MKNIILGFSFIASAITLFQFLVGIQNIPELCSAKGELFEVTSEDDLDTVLELLVYEGLSHNPISAIVKLNGNLIGQSPITNYSIKHYKSKIEVISDGYITETFIFDPIKENRNIIKIFLFPNSPLGADKRMSFIQKKGEASQIKTWRDVLLSVAVLPFGVLFILSLLFGFSDDQRNAFGGNGLIMLLAVFVLFPLSVGIVGLTASIIVIILAAIVNIIYSFEGFS